MSSIARKYGENAAEAERRLIQVKDGVDKQKSIFAFREEDS